MLGNSYIYGCEIFKEVKDILVIGGVVFIRV